MNLEELIKIFERINRISKRIANKEGEGAGWIIKSSEDIETKFEIQKVKSPEEIEDNVTDAFIWFWNIKDYLKEFLNKKGKSKEYIENIVNGDLRLQICADIANSLKHGKLKKSRSGKYPRLGRLSYKIEVTNIDEVKIITDSHTIYELQSHPMHALILSPEDPQKVNIKFPMFDKDGLELGDAIEYIDYAISKWEEIFQLYK